MKIAIIGNIIEAQTISKKIHKFSTNNNINIKQMYFSTENQFLKSTDILSYQLIFIIDSENNRHTMETAYKLKKVNKNYMIIFVSENPSFAIEGYRADISYYLLKPINSQEFELAMKKCIQKLQSNHEEFIIVHSKWQKIPVFLKNIKFAEKSGHNIIIHTFSKKIPTRTSFNEFLKKFIKFPNFVHCIRGIVVNLAWVDKIDSQNFFLKSGEIIPIRRPDRLKMKKLYTEYKLYNNNDDRNFFD